METPKAEQHSFASFEINECVQHQLTITSEMVNIFADMTGDYSPIHIDDLIAQERGFKGRVVHGFLVSAFVSYILGMKLPGEFGLLHDTNFVYKNPVYIGDTLTFTITIKEKHDSLKLLFLKVYIRNQDDVTVCRGNIQCGLAK